MAAGGLGGGPQGGGFVQHAEQLAGHVGRVGGLEEQANLVRADDFAVGGDVGREEGLAGGERFDEDIAEGLREGGGDAEERAVKEPRLVEAGARAQANHDVAHAEFVDQAADGGKFAAVAGDGVLQATFAEFVAEEVDGTDGGELLLVVIDTRQVKNEGLGQRQRGGMFPGLGAQGGVGIHVDAVVNKVDGRQTVASDRPHALGGPATDGDDAVGVAIAGGEAGGDAGLVQGEETFLYVGAARGDEDGDTEALFDPAGGVAAGVAIEGEDEVKGPGAVSLEERAGEKFGPEVLPGGAAIVADRVGKFAGEGTGTLGEDHGLMAPRDESADDEVRAAFGTTDAGEKRGGEEADAQEGLLGAGGRWGDVRGTAGRKGTQV